MIDEPSTTLRPRGKALPQTGAQHMARNVAALAGELLSAALTLLLARPVTIGATRPQSGRPA